jgi:metal-responsive CopG/Arc/MetJ family transcriptional regulator
MEQAITASLPPEDLAALDRVCRDQGVSRPEAVESAVRWYIEREGDLPSIDDLAADETELP